VWLKMGRLAFVSRHRGWESVASQDKLGGTSANRLAGKLATRGNRDTPVPLCCCGRNWRRCGTPPQLIGPFGRRRTVVAGTTVAAADERPPVREPRAVRRVRVEPNRTSALPATVGTSKGDLGRAATASRRPPDYVATSVGNGPPHGRHPKLAIPSSSPRISPSGSGAGSVLVKAVRREQAQG
jgi:hypothetical protein